MENRKMEAMTLEARTMNERVYHRLRELIITGSIPLGTRLDERNLAEEMGISRTPLREAIGKLAKEGIIEHRSYRGNFVRTFTSKQVSDTYEVRKVLEGLATRLAVSSLSEADLDALRDTLGDVQEALDHGDMAKFGDADRRFHSTVARLSGNEMLLESLNRLGGYIQIIRNVANRDPDVVERTTRERPQILKALEARDADRAARLMEEHIEGVRRSVVAQFEALENEDWSNERNLG